MKKIYVLVAFTLLLGTVFSQTATRNGNRLNSDQISVQQQDYSISKQRSVYFSDDFEGTSIDTWTTYDEDGDGYTWGLTSSADQAHGGSGFAISESWSSTDGVLTPNNWMVTSAIDLSSASGTVFLDYYVGPQDQDWPSEKYKCLISTTGNAVADFTVNLYEEIIVVGPENGYTKRSIDVSSYIGETIYLAWVHFDCSDNFRLMLDDVSVYENTTIDVGITAVTAPNNDADCGLTNAEDVTVSIFNYGGFAVNEVVVDYSINGGTAVSETASITIEPGASADYTFTQKADLSVLGYYTIDVNVTLTDDSNENNDALAKKVTNGDAVITVSVYADSNNDELWTILNTAGDTIAIGPDYQWNVTQSDDICVIAADCYTFEFSGFDATGWLELSYNGNVVGGGQTPGNTEGGVAYFGIGDACSANEIGLISLNIPSSSAISTDIDIAGTILNKGSESLTSFDVTYNVDGGTNVAVYSVTGLDIATGATYDFVHDVALNLSEAATYTVNVEVSNPNGAVDGEGDNVLSTSVMVYAEGTARTVLVEEFSTEECPNCPPVATYLGGIAHDNDNVILMVHHAGFYTDEYTIPENEEMLAFFNDGGSTFAPAGMMDRHYNGEANDGDAVNPGPVFWPGSPYGETRIDDRLSEIAFVDVNLSGTYNDDNHTVEVTVSGSFMADFTDDLAVSLWIIEDGITTTTQAGATGEFTHHALVRDAISATFGDAITTSTNSGDTYSSTFTYTVDNGWEKENLTLIALVNKLSSDVNEREVLNAGASLLTELGEQETYNVEFTITDGENPLADAEVKLSGYEMVLTDTLGKAIVVAAPGVDISYTITKEGYADTTATVTVVDQDVMVDVAMVMSVGVVGNKLYEVGFYPNPVSDELFITNLTGASQILVSNVLGQSVLTQSTDELNETITMSDFDKGIYFVTIVDANNNKRTERVIKQ